MQQDQPIPSQNSLAEAIQNLANAIQSTGGAPSSEAESAIPEISVDPQGFQAWLEMAKDKLIDFVPSLVGALVILVLGWIAVKLITALIRKALTKGKFDPTLVNFLSNMLSMGMMIFVLISAVTKLGVNTTSFVALLGAAGFAIGFAMQGSLSNFAAGVMMMIFRPLREGDLVEAGGVLGTVAEIGVFATTVNTLENKKAIIANATITGGNIINYTANGQLRVDMTFGIGYGDDVDKAISIMEKILGTDERVLAEPAPTVALFEHGDSSVNFVCRPHVKPEHYWDVWFDTHKAVKAAFDAQGVSIPFPQRDVHMIPVS